MASESICQITRPLQFLHSPFHDAEPMNALVYKKNKLPSSNHEGFSPTLQRAKVASTLKSHAHSQPF